MRARDVSIHLELSVDGDDVTGRASSPGADDHEFAGWIGLFAAVDALAVTGGNVGATPGQGHPGSVPGDTHRKES